MVIVGAEASQWSHDNAVFEKHVAHFQRLEESRIRRHCRYYVLCL
jgi:hypothetical protein